MNFISFDLELEQPNRKNEITDSQVNKPKIIQVGWVVFNPYPKFQILNENCVHINIGIPLSTFIKKLTHISDENIQNGTTIDKSYYLLERDLEYYNCINCLRQWGAGDHDCLKNEISNNIKWKFGHSAFDVKKMFRCYAQANNLKYKAGLSKASSICGLNWLGHGKHNAYIDSLNTANIFSFIFRRMIDSKS